mmetsp:Transcript_7541/g.21351  ORF Transcript_7541/g.21351 Transcript_7541/m.21351 type:complete len:133 (+) Transcript_7541:1574-1972(+)
MRVPGGKELLQSRSLQMRSCMRAETNPSLPGPKLRGVWLRPRSERELTSADAQRHALQSLPSHRAGPNKAPPELGKLRALGMVWVLDHHHVLGLPTRHIALPRSLTQAASWRNSFSHLPFFTSVRLARAHAP